MTDVNLVKHLKRGTTGGVLLAALGVLLSVVPPILGADETIGLGLLFAARGPIEPPRDVVLVNISRAAALGVGQSEEIDEWPRSLHASLIDALSDAGAEVIAFDIIFEESRSDDAALAAAIRRAGNVILVERLIPDDFGSSGTGWAIVDRRVRPVAELEKAALGTAPFTLPKVPVRVGQFWPFGRTSDDRASLPAAALQAFLLTAYDDLAALIARERPAMLERIPRSRAAVAAAGSLGEVMQRVRAEFRLDRSFAPALRAALPRDSSEALRALIDLYGAPESRYLNFYGPPRTIRTIPYDLASTSADRLDLAGKVVFVGFAEPRPSEEVDVFHSVFSQSNGQNLSGVEIGASAFANMLEGRLLIAPAMPVHLLIVLGWALVLGFVVIASSTRTAIVTSIVAAALYAATAYGAFVAYAVWLPILVPLFVLVPTSALAAVFLNYRDISRQRERVQMALGYYVPRAVVDRLAEQSVSIAAAEQLLHGTCLFTDAEEYTTVSEGLRPGELAALMNDYFSVMFRVVKRHGGMVSNTSGDSMVALWASANVDDDSRMRACRAALEIVPAIAEFNRGRAGLQLPTRLGLVSGEVLLGNIGAEQRFEYRAIGDIVNTASRLQGLNRPLGTRVLMSAATLVEESGIATRDLGSFLLRGKKMPVRVHEAFASGADSGPDQKLLADEFAAALTQFESQRWDAAELAFTNLLARFPDDGPSAFYVTQCVEYRTKPWTGAIVVTEK